MTLHDVLPVCAISDQPNGIPGDPEFASQLTVGNAVFGATVPDVADLLFSQFGGTRSFTSCCPAPRDCIPAICRRCAGIQVRRSHTSDVTAIAMVKNVRRFGWWLMTGRQGVGDDWGASVAGDTPDIPPPSLRRVGTTLYPAIPESWIDARIRERTILVHQQPESVCQWSGLTSDGAWSRAVHPTVGFMRRNAKWSVTDRTGLSDLRCVSALRCSPDSPSRSTRRATECLGVRTAAQLRRIPIGDRSTLRAGAGNGRLLGHRQFTPGGVLRPVIATNNVGPSLRQLYHDRCRLEYRKDAQEVAA